LNINFKSPKVPNILKTAGNFAKSSKFQPYTRITGVLQGMIIAISNFIEIIFFLPNYFF